MTSTLCYLCGSPVEIADADEVSVYFLSRKHKRSNHLICSICTDILRDAKSQLKRAGKVLIIKSAEGVANIVDPSKYIIDYRNN
jgi:hypothetical protein